MGRSSASMRHGRRPRQAAWRSCGSAIHRREAIGSDRRGTTSGLTARRRSGAIHPPSTRARANREGTPARRRPRETEIGRMTAWVHASRSWILVAEPVDFNPGGQVQARERKSRGKGKAKAKVKAWVRVNREKQASKGGGTLQAKAGDTRSTGGKGTLSMAVDLPGPSSPILSGGKAGLAAVEFRWAAASKGAQPQSKPWFAPKRQQRRLRQ
jgi:hypothetical protein